MTDLTPEKQPVKTPGKPDPAIFLEAARRLGIGRATFYRRAQRHGLTREDGFPG